MIAPPRLMLCNARLIDPSIGHDAPGGVMLEDGKIADVGAHLFQPPANADETADLRVIDCLGAVAAPGLVDMRASVGEPGQEHKETIHSASAAAARGGITSLACLPNTDPPLDSVSSIEFIARRARETKGVKIYPYATVTKNAAGVDLTEIGLLTEAGVHAFTDGNHAVADSLVMRRALSYAAAFDALIVQHPEDPRVAPTGVMNAGEISTRLGLPGIPPQAEAIMIERDLRLVEMTGTRYHIAHVSTALAIEVIRAAKRRGLPVTCDTAPPYFALSEVDVGDYLTFARLSPPLRTLADRAAVAAGVVDGTIDAVASDHQPQDEDAKRQPFALAAPGMVGLETLLVLALELHHRDNMPLIDLLGALSTRPADILRLPQGRLRVGSPADIVVFDPDRPGLIDADSFQSRSHNTMFDGRPVMGAVLATIVDGRPIYETTTWS